MFAVQVQSTLTHATSGLRNILSLYKCPVRGSVPHLYGNLPSRRSRRTVATNSAAQMLVLIIHQWCSGKEAWPISIPSSCCILGRQSMDHTGSHGYLQSGFLSLNLARVGAMLQQLRSKGIRCS
ncbi:hypothetical protein Bbelb_209310 [Branchiostoma belcheri]|nr:hypothetical protein Bbelb_209310 [Branchiostoma belcheri]